MATARISYSLPPHIDATEAPLAFGSRALPKLNRELQDPVLITRQRALMTLCNLCHDPEKVYEAINVGCVGNLKKLLEDEDSTVRHKATEVLYIMATHNVGRNAFLEYGVIKPVAKLFDDQVEIVRKFAHLALRMVSELPSGAVGIVQAELIPTLVVKLENELDDMRQLILDTLHFCMHVDPEAALAAGIMRVLTALLLHDASPIRARAARDVMDAAVPFLGKREAVADPAIVQTLVARLVDSDEQVQTNAAGALMTIAITTAGKFATIKAGAIPYLLQLVQAQFSETRLYAMKALTMLAEAPEGRATLQSFVEDKATASLDLEESAAVRRAAAIATKVITWKP